ncbi:hemolysin family protein [Acidicapsa ligni]|uniref:hemolysin family protein n=1 Tax=Acidicapsa ligni TaxID=542300 RepID=UPI0021DFE78E|nr:hemolysin family protein [Acidicapsa ligni]
MSIGSLCILILLAGILTIAAYVTRVHYEFGKILSREVQDNLDAWEEHIESRLWISRERGALAASVLMHLSMGMLALELGRVLFDRAANAGRPSTEEIFQAVLIIILIVVFCTQVVPFLLFQRTKGLWVVRLLWAVRLLLLVVFPVTLLISFLLSIATLAEEPVTAEEETAGDVEALLEAGEEEGILEESDRELVRSAVEFGDLLVRDIMTPRPQIFAVPESITLVEFLEELREHNYSRVPVYAGTLDAVTGIAFAHDLLQITDEEARVRTVATIRRPVALVPETKKGYELLRDMQREKQHMRIVIDEYGEVAGLVTIEDLLEQIVGNIGDEHEDEEDARVDDPQRISEGVWEVPGGFPVDRLDELAGPDWHPEEEDYEAQTVGGLVSEAEGRIPHAGEVVEIGSVRIEVVASSDRRVEKVRIFVTPDEFAAQAEDENDERSIRSRTGNRSNGNGSNGTEVE